MVFSKCLMMVIAKSLRFPTIFFPFFISILAQEELKFSHLGGDKEKEFTSLLLEDAAESS